MKICYFGDAESIHVQRWCKHFAALGNEVHLISFKNEPITGISCHYVNTGEIAVSGGNWKVLLHYRKVKKLLREIKPDIFHALYATSYGITGALCRFHPYVITTLGSDVLVSPQNSKVYRILLRFAFRRADWITAMAEHMRTAIIELGASPNKVSTVPFGIDPQIFNRSGRSLPENAFVLTSTRNFEPVYNIPQLIEAVALVHDQIPGLRLNLIGAGSLKSEYEALIARLNLSTICHFNGKIPQAEIANTLRQSHVFVSVSRSDGNNISLNEAMACGAWCIASDIPANTQWIEDGQNGFLVKLDDAQGLADKIVSSWHNYQALQEKAIPMNEHIIAERGLWNTNMEKVNQTYNTLMKSL